MYSLKCDYYGAEFTCIGDLIAHIMISGMDPDYEITKDGNSIGQKAIDYILFQWGGAGPNSYLHVIKL